MIAGLHYSVLQAQPRSPKINKMFIMENALKAAAWDLKGPTSGPSFHLAYQVVFLSVPGSTTLFAELYDAKCRSGSYGRSAGSGAEW